MLTDTQNRYLPSPLKTLDVEYPYRREHTKLEDCLDEASHLLAPGHHCADLPSNFYKRLTAVLQELPAALTEYLTARRLEEEPQEEVMHEVQEVRAQPLQKLFEHGSSGGLLDELKSAFLC